MKEPPEGGATDVVFGISTEKVENPVDETCKPYRVRAILLL